MSSEITRKSSNLSGSRLLGGWLNVPVFLFVMLLGACIIFAQLGKFPLFNPDEALYAEPAREMLEIKEYITTYLNYVVRFTKPPLVIWAMALSYQVFGVNEFAARFFGAGLGLLLVGVTYLAASRYLSTTAAFLAAGSLITAPLYLGTAREAITDMPLAFFMASAQLAFFHAFESGKKGFAYLAWALVGLSVMTKGPVGIVLPLGILFCYHLMRGDIKKAWRAYCPIGGLLLTALISLPWFIVEIYVTKGAYFQEFIMRENFQRFTAVVDAHKQPFWYHMAAMTVGYLPFSVFIPGLIATGVKILREFLKGMEKKRAIWTEIARLRSICASFSGVPALMLYCALWTVLTVGFFSISVSKLLPYTLPAFPALALLVANYLDNAVKGNRFFRLSWPMFFLVVLFCGAGGVAPVICSKLRDAPEGLQSLIVGYAAFSASAVLVSLAIMRFNQLRNGLICFTLTSALGLSFYALRILPVVSDKWEGGLPTLSALAGASQLPIIVFDMRKPGVPFYALRRVENINDINVLQSRLAALGEAYILTKLKRQEVLTSLPGIKVISSQGSFTLLRYGKVTSNEITN